MEDLRPLLLSGSSWFESLKPPTEDVPSPWFVAKAPLEEHWVGQLLTAAAAFAREHGLVTHYRKRFAGISSEDLTPERARIHRCSVSTPIWEIAHELVVARYLEKVLLWEYEGHEPPGYKQARGDWLFRSCRGRDVFVEVKSLAEPELAASTGPYNRGIHYAKIRNAIKGAYKQIPDDGRSILVVLVGREILHVPRRLMLGDIFQTMFGQFQVRFKPFVENPKFTGGPSFHDMLVHGTKHRRLGCIAGLELTGTDYPHVPFYAIDNPFANPQTRLPPADLANCRRFVFDSAGHGEDLLGLGAEETWALMA